MTATHDDLVAAAHAHAAAEAVGDLDAVFATLEDDPLYEFQPVGLSFRGMDATRRYYDHFFSTFSTCVAGSALRTESVAPDGVVQEYTIWTNTGADGGRLMLGPVYEECTPIEVGEPG